MIITETAKNKVLSLLKDTEECIEYPILNKDGYGLIQGYDENGKKLKMLAHRVSYQLYYHDDISSNDIICHKCDNPKCINPLHLFKGTHADNVADKVAKGRQAKGTQNGRYIDGRTLNKTRKNRVYGILSKEQVLEVRKLKSEGIKLITISERLNIPYQTVKDISCGRSYINI